MIKHLPQLIDVPEIAKMIGFSLRHTRRILDAHNVPRVHMPTLNNPSIWDNGTGFKLKYKREVIEAFIATYKPRVVSKKKGKDAPDGTGTTVPENN